jgi:vacuolar-type H+-ATPase subunit I/STV1
VPSATPEVGPTQQQNEASTDRDLLTLQSVRSIKERKRALAAQATNNEQSRHDMTIDQMKGLGQALEETKVLVRSAKAAISVHGYRNIKQLDNVDKKLKEQDNDLEYLRTYIDVLHRLQLDSVARTKSGQDYIEGRLKYIDNNVRGNQWFLRKFAAVAVLYLFLATLAAHMGASERRPMH